MCSNAQHVRHTWSCVVNAGSDSKQLPKTLSVCVDPALRIEIKMVFFPPHIKSFGEETTTLSEGKA